MTETSSDREEDIIADLLIQELIHYVEEPGVTLLNTLDLPSTLRCVCKHLSSADDGSELLQQVSSALQTYERSRAAIRERAFANGGGCATDFASSCLVDEVLDNIHGDIEGAVDSRTKALLQQQQQQQQQRNGTSINKENNHCYNNSEIEIIQQILSLAEESDPTGETSNNIPVRPAALCTLVDPFGRSFLRLIPPQNITQRMASVQECFDKLGIA